MPVIIHISFDLFKPPIENRGLKRLLKESWQIWFPDFYAPLGGFPLTAKWKRPLSLEQQWVLYALTKRLIRKAEKPVNVRKHMFAVRDAAERLIKQEKKITQKSLQETMKILKKEKEEEKKRRLESKEAKKE